MFCSFPSAFAATKIVVIMSNEAEAFKNAEEALEAQVGSAATFEVFSVKADGEDAIPAKLTAAAPQVIVALGTKAVAIAKAAAPATPTVFGMLLDPVAAGVVTSFSPQGGSLTGVVLDIPADVQLAQLKALCSSAKNIGFLFDPKTKSAVKEANVATASSLGLTLVPKPVYTKKSAESAAVALLDTVDALWGDTDSSVYNTETAPLIIAATLAKKKPFLVYSASYVKAGALAACEVDYIEHGKQVGDLVKKIIAGANPGTLAIEVPRKIGLVVNKTTAESISGISIPSDAKTI